MDLTLTIQSEIEEYCAINDRLPVLYMGDNTFRKFSKILNCEYEPLCKTKNEGYINQYRGVHIVEADFEYGYFLK